MTANIELGMMTHASNPSYSVARGRMVTRSRTTEAKLARLYFKNKNTNKSHGGMADVIEPSSSMHEALGSIPSTVKTAAVNN
jgi:hypothetical protein